MAEHIDQSTAPLDEKLRRFLQALAKPDAVHFYGDGYPRPTIAAEAYAFLADIAAGRLIVAAAGVPACVRCSDTGAVRTAGGEQWPCPQCNGGATDGVEPSGGGEHG